MLNAILKMRPRHLSAIAAAVAVVTTGVVWGMQYEEDEEAAQAGVDVTPVEGGPRQEGPLPTGSLQPSHSVVDVSLNTSLGPVRLVRRYAGSTDTWAYKLASKLPELYSPPFGRVPLPDSGYSLQWWHSFYSFVYHVPPSFHPGNEIDGSYTVRDIAGEVAEFQELYGAECEPICWLVDSDAPVPHRLERLDGGSNAYVLYESGARLVYLDEYPQDSEITFVSQVQNEQGVPVADVLYGGPACDMEDAGVPYVSAVRTADGQVLRFHYSQQRSRLSTDAGMSCVLDHVTLDGIDGGASGDTVVQYGYPADGGNGSGTAGLLESAEWPLLGQKEWYVLDYNGYPVWEIDEQYGSGARQLVTRQCLETDSRNRVYADCLYDGHVVQYISATDPGGASCSPGDLSGCPRQWQIFTTTDTTPGDGGTPATGPTVKRWHDVTVSSTLGVKDTCAGTGCDAVSSPATNSWIIEDSGPRGNKAIKDRTSGYTAYTNTNHAGACSVGSIQVTPKETSAMMIGATNPDGGGALQTTHYTYQYGPNCEQHVEESTTTSVVNASATASTKYEYDSTTNRLKSVTRYGKTKVLSGGTWTEVPRYIKTFYLASKQCSGSQTVDDFNRIVETHGPCLVSSTSDAECNGEGPLPVTQYTYYGSTGDARANKLQQKKVFVSGVTYDSGGLDCSSARALTMEYNEYDAFGHVLKETDSNGAVTQREYQGDRLVKLATPDPTTGNPTSLTSFIYDSATGHVLRIEYPHGHRELFCYRTGADADCSGGTATDRLQWMARSNGSTIQEKTGYNYFKGALVQARVYDSLGSLRRVKNYGKDPYRRPTFEGWGDAEDFHVTKRFNDNGQLDAVGLPYNDPPWFCLYGEGFDETDCKGYNYDKARRLKSVVEYADGINDKRTCLFYDDQGNVKEVDFGENSCSQGDGVRFAYDDFGNVLKVEAPWLGSNAVQYEYDALGNVVKKATPAMGTDYVAYSYDAMGRTLAAKRVSGGTEETLYSFSYDDAQTATGCTGDNTKGRLHVQTDSFGESWFSYDKAGQLTRVYRRRDTAACSAEHSDANPNSIYEYDTGRLVAQEYPHGRRIEYGYGSSSGGMQDHVKQISVRLYSADGGTETKTLVDNIKWEPFGGVASYEVVSPTDASRLKVEYFPGMSSSASGDCSSSQPSEVDHSGRLRGLWVSKIASSGASGTGDVFKRTYTWKADQLIQEATCLLSTSGQPQRENFSTRDGGTAGYDHALRLTHVSRDGGTEFIDTGGALGRRDYTYDARGNRLTDVADCWCFQSTYTNRDQLVSRTAADAGVSGCTCAGGAPGEILSAYGNTFTYDADGRVSEKHWPADSVGAESQTFDTTIDASHAALGAVYRRILNNDATYEYYYDAAGRRRAKQYPTSYKDEFFYSGTNLLEDRGLSTAAAAPDSYPIDEYIWLNERPVVLIKSQFSTGWSRQPDSEGTCTRNSEGVPCGVYFPVTDYLRKPVLLMDSSRRVAGVGDYDPFGHVSRVTYVSDTPHPYSSMSTSERVLGFFSQKPTSTTSVKLRARYAYVDTATGTYTYLSDQWGSELTGARSQGEHVGREISNWVQVPTDGQVQVRFYKGGSDPGTRYGAILEGYEYRRYETGATPVWLPLRFPGQYHDAEVDLFENWNRWYDPSIGRYLAPDPVLYRGQAVPVYAYAGNNPIIYSDPTGLLHRERRFECVFVPEPNGGGHDSCQYVDVWVEDWYDTVVKESIGRFVQYSAMHERINLAVIDQFMGPGTVAANPDSSGGSDPYSNACRVPPEFARIPIQQNVAEARASSGLSFPSKLAYMYDAFSRGGRLDYWKNTRDPTLSPATQYNYGAVGAALGLDPVTLVVAAGIYQLETDATDSLIMGYKDWFQGSFECLGDDCTDQAYIIKGILDSSQCY